MSRFVDSLTWRGRAGRALYHRHRADERRAYRRDLKAWAAVPARAADQLWPTVKGVWRFYRAITERDLYCWMAGFLAGVATVAHAWTIPL